MKGFDSVNNLIYQFRDYLKQELYGSDRYDQSLQNMMGYKFKQICFAFLLLVSVSSYYILPLRAGTVLITDSQIRSNKIVNKMIGLNLSRTVYEAHKDINTIATITSLAMDQNLNFYINYTVVCPENDCFLNVTLLRYTEFVNSGFSYRIVVDYLVARGLKVKDLNMTSFQEHVFLKDVVSFNEKNQPQILGKDIPYNNQDAWYMLLFPTGFNNLTLTGHVVYSYIFNSDMYVVHYMDHSGGHGQHDSMGWKENQNYIKYRAVFIPPSYLNLKDCVPVQNFELNQHFQHACSGGKKVKWFAGFKSTKEKQFQGELFEQLSGFSYSLASTPTRYGLMAFPFQVSEDFIDLRTHEYKWDVQYHQFGVYLGYTIALVIIILIGFLLYVFFKPFLIKRDHRKNFKKVKKYDIAHEEQQFSQH